MYRLSLDKEEKLKTLYLGFLLRSISNYVTDTAHILLAQSALGWAYELSVIISVSSFITTIRKFKSIELSGMEICRLPSQPAVIHLWQVQTAGIYSIKTPRFSPNIQCSLTDESSSKNPDSKNRMFILGMGFVGKFLAADLKSNGW